MVTRITDITNRLYFDALEAIAKTKAEFKLKPGDPPDIAADEALAIVRNKFKELYKHFYSDLEIKELKQRLDAAVDEFVKERFS